MVVYLAGPIFGCSDDDATGWRRYATDRLAHRGHSVLDPMRRDYRGTEDGNHVAIVEADLADIAAADAVLVNGNRPSWGTAMELVYARERGKRIVAWVEGPVSPWLRYHAESTHTVLERAVRAVVA